MKPRSFWHVFFTLSFFVALFVILLSLACSLFSVKFLYALRIWTWGGIGFMLIAGIPIAYFLKSVAISVSFQNKDVFLSRLSIALAELSFHPAAQTGDLLTFMPPRRNRFLDATISVRTADNSATLVGPNSYIKSGK